MKKKYNDGKIVMEHYAANRLEIIIGENSGFASRQVFINVKPANNWLRMHGQPMRRKGMIK